MYNFEIWLVALTWQCGQSCYVCFFLFVLLLVLHHHHHLHRLYVYFANSLGLFTYRFVFSVYFVEEINGKEPKRKVPRNGCSTNTPGNALSLNLLTVCVCMYFAPNLNNSPDSLAPFCVSLFLYVVCMYVCVCFKGFRTRMLCK